MKEEQPILKSDYRPYYGHVYQSDATLDPWAKNPTKVSDYLSSEPTEELSTKRIQLLNYIDYQEYCNLMRSCETEKEVIRLIWATCAWYSDSSPAKSLDWLYHTLKLFNDFPNNFGAEYHNTIKKQLQDGIEIYKIATKTTLPQEPAPKRSYHLEEYIGEENWTVIRGMLINEKHKLDYNNNWITDKKTTPQKWWIALIVSIDKTYNLNLKNFEIPSILMDTFSIEVTIERVNKVIKHIDLITIPEPLKNHEP